MDSEPLNFAALDTWLQQQGQKKLSNTQRLLLQACIGSERVTYEQLAAKHNYSAEYIRCRVATNLWKQLSKAAGERITKVNCGIVLTKLPLENNVAATNAGSPENQLAGDRAPTPRPHLEYPNGVVPLNSRFYIPRLPMENRCKREILKPCTLLRIKSPHSMGKSSLLSRLLGHAKSRDFTTVQINFQAVDFQMLADVERALRWICIQICQALELPSNLDAYWNEDLGCKMSCSLYFKKYVLPQVNGPLVLAFDEASVLFDYPEVSQEFFTMLRTWHEYTKVEPAWEEVRLVLVQATDSYVQLNVNQSPFNVGLGMSLARFSPTEGQQLRDRYPLNLSDNQLKQLMTLVAGHPYLMRLALYHLARQDITFSELLHTAASNSGIFSHHLQYRLWLLQQRPELSRAMQQILATTEPITLPQAIGFKLQSMGLVTLVQNAAQVSCPLYREYLKGAIA